MMSSIITSIHDRHGLRKFKYADDFTSDALDLYFKSPDGSFKRDDLLKNQPLKKKTNTTMHEFINTTRMRVFSFCRV